MAPYLVGIAGGTASGKTTLTRRMYEIGGAEQVAVVELDRYYRAQDHIDLSRRVATNYDHPLSLESELLVQHLQALKAGRAVHTPVYDFVRHTRCASSSIVVEPRRVILVEGILVFAIPELRDLFDFRIFVDAPTELRLRRRTERDVLERGRTEEEVLKQWNTTVHPMHLEFLEPSRAAAHMVFDGSQSDEPLAGEIWRKLLSQAQAA
jgi:uridine kinase